MYLEGIARPASASTAATNWSNNSSQSIGHNVPHRQIPIIKGDVNFIHNPTSEDPSEHESISSESIKDLLERLTQIPISTSDHEGILEFLYELFYMNPLYNQDDSRIARIFIENDFVAMAHQCLAEYLRQGIFSTATIRRSTQFILYTLWNLTGISVEFRLYLTNKRSLVEFLLEELLQYLTGLEADDEFQLIIDNLIQSVLSILHNITLNVHHLNIDTSYDYLKELLAKQDASKVTERFRLTIFLCLINLNPRRVAHHLTNTSNDVFASTLTSLFRFLKKIVQQEILMIRTGLSAWLLVNSINKLPADFILQDDNRLYSLMVLLKRGIRDEKLQACSALNRCIRQSIHAKQLIEKDVNCWKLLQQYQNLLDSEPVNTN